MHKYTYRMNAYLYAWLREEQEIKRCFSRHWDIRLHVPRERVLKVRCE